MLSLLILVALGICIALHARMMFRGHGSQRGDDDAHEKHAGNIETSKVAEDSKGQAQHGGYRH